MNELRDMINDYRDEFAEVVLERSSDDPNEKYDRMYNGFTEAILSLIQLERVKAQEEVILLHKPILKVCELLYLGKVVPSELEASANAAIARLGQLLDKGEEK